MGFALIIFMFVHIAPLLSSVREKRLVLHSDTDVALEISNLQQLVIHLQQETADLQKETTTLKQETATLRQNEANLQNKVLAIEKGQGSTYVRWGRTSCSGNGTEKVYSGFTGGGPYHDKGGPASYVCLPQHPTWAKYQDGIQDIGAYMSGSEYEAGYGGTFNPFSKNMYNQDAPCVVCRSPRPTSIMIPARTDCYSGWTLEYTGYLMSVHRNHDNASDYVCVDADPEAVYHGEADLDGKLMYVVEVKCGSLPCQEYPEGRELACVVCSK